MSSQTHNSLIPSTRKPNQYLSISTSNVQMTIDQNRQNLLELVSSGIKGQVEGFLDQMHSTFNVDKDAARRLFPTEDLRNLFDHGLHLQHSVSYLSGALDQHRGYEAFAQKMNERTNEYYLEMAKIQGTLQQMQIMAREFFNSHVQEVRMGAKREERIEEFNLRHIDAMQQFNLRFSENSEQFDKRLAETTNLFTLLHSKTTTQLNTRIDDALKKFEDAVIVLNTQIKSLQSEQLELKKLQGQVDNLQKTQESFLKMTLSGQVKELVAQTFLWGFNLLSTNFDKLSSRSYQELGAATAVGVVAFHSLGKVYKIPGVKYIASTPIGMGRIASSTLAYTAGAAIFKKVYDQHHHKLIDAGNYFLSTHEMQSSINYMNKQYNRFYPKKPDEAMDFFIKGVGVACVLGLGLKYRRHLMKWSRKLPLSDF